MTDRRSGRTEQEAGQSGHLLDAVLAISSDLSLPAVLRRIVRTARELADAEYAALGVLGPGSDVEQIRLIEFITEGASDDVITRIGHYPTGKGVLGLLIRDPRPIRIHDLGSDPHSSGFPSGHPEMHTFLGVPVRIRESVFGNLYLTEKRGGADFTSEDEETVVALAGAAGVVIENARLQERMDRLVLLEDRERIARDLHDTVIQRLFATGLSLQGLGRLVDPPELADRIQQAVDELDATIREIRGVIFALQAHERGDQSLRVQVLALAADMKPLLNTEPRVHFDGPIDAAIEDQQGTAVLAALRELLTNVAKHAGATSVEVYLTAGAEVVLRVEDDGKGPGKARKGGKGLGNVRHRALALGGAFDLRRREPKGSVAEWRVPRRISETASGADGNLRGQATAQAL